VSPGARHVPLVLSLALAVLGAIVLFKALTLETEGGDPVGAIAWRALLVVVASVLGFGVVLPLLGLVLTIPLLTVLVSLAAGDFDWKAVLLSSVLLTLVSWAIFVGVLGRELPMRPVLFGG
ncbi:MAG: tripartite tricarboxylate transporter TctB family protein, partial [Burkholderiaceae bacterium]